MLNRVIATIVTLLAVTSAHAAIYKWVDESGVVQYTQQPPITGEVSEIAPPPPPAEDPQTARERLQEQIRSFEERREARIQESEEATQTAAEAAETSEFCRKARENLAIAEANTRVMERGADGTLTPLTEEQLASKRQLLQAQIQELCQ